MKIIPNLLVMLLGSTLIATPVFADEPGLNQVPGYVLNEGGGEIFEKIATFNVDRTSDGVDVGGIHLMKFKSTAPGAMKEFLIDRFTGSHVGMDGHAADAVDVDGVNWYRLNQGVMDEWYRYDEDLNALLQYMHPRASVTDEEAKAFLAAFDQSQR